MQFYNDWFGAPHGEAGEGLEGARLEPVERGIDRRRGGDGQVLFRLGLHQTI